MTATSTGEQPGLLATTRRHRVRGYVLLAALAYVPALLTDIGRVSAESKNYLYLDPGRLLSRAPSLWDPNIGLGTVSHQMIGYLFPVGPFYWVLDQLGIPPWMAQRLWLGSLLFLAGAGMLYLFRTLGSRGPGAPAAAVLYMLTPYALQYSSKHLVLVLPWVALPWMLGLVIRALRDGGWRYPAAFAIVVQLAGSINATALLLVGLAPALWIVYAIWITKEVSWRRGLAVTAKIAGLTLFASLWWIAGLWAQGSYGIDVLRFTETLRTVTTTSTAPDVLRGLGYWFFYGNDTVSRWNEISSWYAQNLAVIAASFVLPALAMLGAVLVRWRYRLFFVAIILLGVALSVGAYPYDDSSPFGEVFKLFAEGSNVGLAFRSSTRAVPMVLLGLAMLLGVGINVLAVRAAGWARPRPRLGLAISAAVCCVAILNYPAMWTGGFYSESLMRDAEIPQYWTDAIRELDQGSHDTRIFEIPGSDFANYTWGGTVEPITPGLTDRPYVAREIVPWGSNASADLVNAIDRQLQERILDMNGLAALARLMSVGDVVLRNDLDVRRYKLVRPDEIEALLTPRPAGLGSPQGYGPEAVNKVFLDARTLSLVEPPQATAPVMIYHVEDPQPIVRSAATTGQLFVAGSAAGLVSAAPTGILDTPGAILFAGSYAGEPDALREALDPRATLLVTDSNRRRPQRWTSLHGDVGATERAGERALRDDSNDNRLEVFPDAGDDSRTVVEQVGARVSATSYGTVLAYSPEVRPAYAFDGNLSSTWRAGGGVRAVGEKLVIEFDQGITTDHLTLVQPQTGDRSRFITSVRLVFDGDHSERVALGPESFGPAGQVVEFPRRSFRRLEIVVDDTNLGDRVDLATTAVGFAEVIVGDDGPGSTPFQMYEVVRMPVDLLEAVGAASLDHRLVFVMERLRATQTPERTPDELTLLREFTLPTARAFDLRGVVRLSSQADDATLDRVSGLGASGPGGITVTSSQRLIGSTAARGSSALDGRFATSWTTPYDAVVGQHLDVTLGQSRTFDRLYLQLVADGLHSVPTQITVAAADQRRVVPLPAIEDGKPGTGVLLPVKFAPLTGDHVTVTIDAIRTVISEDYDAFRDSVSPVAIAELGLPGVVLTTSDRLPTECRLDLVSVDDQPVAVRLDGTRADLEAGRAVDLQRCDPNTMQLAAGSHVVVGVSPETSGLDVDRLTVASNAGGAALVLGPGGTIPEDTSSVGESTTPKVRVTQDGRTSMDVRVTGATEPFWLVLGQSQNAGWYATTGSRDLGESSLVDGFANGWRIDPETTGASFTVTLEWTPQRWVGRTVVISALALLACLALIFFRRRRARDTTPDAHNDPAGFAGVPDPSPVLLRRAQLIGGSIAVLGLGVLLSRWWVGLVAGALFALGATRPRWRILLRFGAPACLAFVGAYIVIQQYRIDYPQPLEWPQFFNRVHHVGWLAVILLVADSLLVALSLGASRGSPRREP